MDDETKAAFDRLRRDLSMEVYIGGATPNVFVGRRDVEQLLAHFNTEPSRIAAAVEAEREACLRAVRACREPDFDPSYDPSIPPRREAWMAAIDDAVEAIHARGSK